MTTSSRVRISVERALSVPLSTQIRDQVVAAVSVGDLKEDERLPPVRQLADFLGLNRNTVAQAYRALEREGYVITRAGGGTIVAASPATRSAVHHRQLRQLVRKALEEAKSHGFGPEEFGQLAYYEGARWAAPHEVTVLVVDEYQGELEFLSKAVREQVGTEVRSMSTEEVEQLLPAGRSREFESFDFALVPSYSLSRVAGLLSEANLPILGVGLGPSLSALASIAQVPRENRVTIVCTEPSGMSAMETALATAQITFPHARKVSLRDENLGEAIAWAEIVIASQGSLTRVHDLAPNKPIIAYSTTVDESSLAAIRGYAEQIAKRRAQQTTSPG